jgi:hypothetical protein
VVKVKSKEYEFNVYVVDGVARLSAYEMKYLDNPENQEPAETNGDKWHTLEIPMTMANYGELAYLLEDPKWHVPKEEFEMADGEVYTEPQLLALAVESWQDHDAWEGGEAWLAGLPTQRLADWVAGLPEYEPAPAHEWTMTTPEVFEQLRLSPERPVYADVKCKNCDESYQVGKLW